VCFFLPWGNGQCWPVDSFIACFSVSNPVSGPVMLAALAQLVLCCLTTMERHGQLLLTFSSGQNTQHTL
jgi:hypothetical protein